MLAVPSEHGGVPSDATAGPGWTWRVQDIEVGISLETFDWTVLPCAEQQTPARVLAGRYALTDSLGRGGQGSVYAADDLLTGARVAVKILPSLGAAAQRRVNLELTALRWLRMPGVVRLLDDGVVDDLTFLVMESVEGSPFPDGPVNWLLLEPLALSLLETLDAVHAAGVLHRDVKPDNILIDDEGRPVLIDFGLARGASITLGRGRRCSGTLQYCSPEQLAGRSCDARSDLYSLAVVLYESLCGYLPHGSDPNRIMARHQRGDLPRVPLCVPEGVSRVLMAMLSPDPEYRPRSAAQVIEMLGGAGRDERVEQLCEGLLEQSTARELERLFCGPDHFLHLPEDAAAVLHQRTAGWKDELTRELGRWLRRGFAHNRDGLLAVSRLAIDRLGEPKPPVMLSPRVAVEQLLLEIEGLVLAGHRSRARGRIDIGIGIGRRFGLLEPLRRLLELAVSCALADRTRVSIDRILSELGRARDCGLGVEDLGWLVRAVRFAGRGEQDRARRCVARVPEFEDEELEAWRQCVPLLSPRIPVHEAEELLEGLESWARDDARRGRLASWRGIHLYRQGRFEEALALHVRALGAVQGESWRVLCLSNAANAALWADDFAQAQKLAAQVRDEAQALRWSRQEALGILVLRTAAYRQRQILPPQPQLVDAAESLGPWRALQLGLCEAAFAWRGEQRSLGLELALRTRASARAVSFDDVVFLAEALATVLGGPRFAPSGAWPGRDPSFAIQTLGLRAIAEGPSPELFVQATGLAGQLKHLNPTTRLELLSIEEGLIATGA